MTTMMNKKLAILFIYLIIPTLAFSSPVDSHLNKNPQTNGTVTWCAGEYPRVYIVDVDLGMPSNGWGNWRIYYSTKPYYDSSAREITANSGRAIDQYGGQAMYAAAINAMNNQLYVEIGDDRGTACDDFDILETFVPGPTP